MITRIQQHTPKDLLGRVMSLMLFFNGGLVPVTQAVAGAVSKWSLTAVFIGAGAAILLFAAGSGIRPELMQAELGAQGARMVRARRTPPTTFLGGVLRQNYEEIAHRAVSFH